MKNDKIFISKNPLIWCIFHKSTHFWINHMQCLNNSRKLTLSDLDFFHCLAVAISSTILSCGSSQQKRARPAELTPPRVVPCSQRCLADSATACTFSRCSSFHLTLFIFFETIDSSPVTAPNQSAETESASSCFKTGADWSE